MRAFVDTSPALSNTDFSQVRDFLRDFCSHAIIKYNAMEIELGHQSGLDHARSIHQALLLSLEVIRHWAEKIPGFSELNKDDQNHLLETAFLQLFVARLGYR